MPKTSTSRLTVLFAGLTAVNSAVQSPNTRRMECRALSHLVWPAHGDWPLTAAATFCRSELLRSSQSETRQDLKIPAARTPERPWQRRPEFYGRVGHRQRGQRLCYGA